MSQLNINQLNGRLQNSPTIQFYLSLCTDESRYSNDWRHKYFSYKRGERVDRLTPSGNFIYGAAVREFERLINSEYYNYSRDNKTEDIEIQFCGKVLQFRVAASQDIKGIYLTYQTNFAPIGRERQKHKIRSNSTFANLDLKEYFLAKVLPKYLFADGIFRNIQILRNCSKAEAIEFYKERISIKAEKRTESIDLFKAWKRLFKRRLNIEIADDLSLKYLAALYHSYTRQKTRKRLFKSPSIFEISEMYQSEHDTEDHIESFLDSYYEDNFPKNAIFI